MIEFCVTEEERLLSEAAERFGQDQLRPLEREHERDGYSDPLRAAYDDLGFSGLGVPEDLGGAGFDVSQELAAWQALAAADSTAPLALGRGPGLTTLASTPSGRGVIASGDLGGVCWGGGLNWEDETVSGSVDWIPAVAPTWLVLVTADQVGLVRTPAFTAVAGQSCGLRGAGGVRVELDATPFEALGDATLAARLLTECRVFVGATILGAARDANAAAIKYAKERVAFGKPIAHHQGLAFQLVDVAMDVTGAALLLEAAAVTGGVAEVANAYAHAVEVSLRAAERSVQALGGHGYLTDHRVEKRMRDIRALTTLFGGPLQAELDAAAMLCDLPEPLEVVQ